MKTLYTRVVLTTLVVMAVSFFIAFLGTNIYYHYQLKPENDERITQTAQQVQQFYENHPSINTQTYFEQVGDTGFQVALFSSAEEEGRFFGSSFRSSTLSPKNIENVLAGDTYHGVKNHPFGPLVTGFFDNELTNTVGVPVEVQGETYAMFLRPDIEYQLGEFRYFLAFLFGGMVGISVLLVLISTRYLVRPLVKLTEATKRITKGDFSPPVPVQRQDEIGQLARQFSQMSRELEQLEYMRQEFVANVSHEIQSPLTTIQGMAAELEHDQLSPEQQQMYASTIHQESRRLSSLGKQLLILASLDKEEERLAVAPYALDQQLKTMVQSMAYQCQERQIFVDIDVPPTIIEGDEVLLYEVWMNLFANAIRHSPMEASIVIWLEPRSTDVVVTIQDEGPGLSPEVLPFIFERFYRADKARSRSYESNGLGLSIAQKIVERHHGFISASSTEDQGATFTVVLPYTPFDS